MVGIPIEDYLDELIQHQNYAEHKNRSYHMVDNEVQTLEERRFHCVCVDFFPHSLEEVHSIASKMVIHENPLNLVFFLFQMEESIELIIHNHLYRFT